MPEEWDTYDKSWEERSPITQEVSQMVPKRYALVSLKGATGESIARYLPDNYKISAEVGRANAFDDSDYEGCFGPCVLIEGRDNCGWTLHEYVLPRLASGLIVGREIDLSHPVMKEV